MVQRRMKQPQLKNYLKPSLKTGTYSYRRAIPTKLKHQFFKDNGTLRGAEWKESLKTSSLSIALKRAVEVNAKFEQTKMLAKHTVVASSNNKTDIDAHNQAIEYYRRLGLHPDQAPHLLKSGAEQQAWINKSIEAQRELSDYQEIVGIDEVWRGSFENSEYVTNEKYHFLQDQIDWLRGDSSKIKNRLKATWASATDDYIRYKNKWLAAENTASASVKDTRSIRVAASFATSLGSGVESVGAVRFLTDITKRDARRWVEQQMVARSGATVAREISTLMAIFNRAIEEYGDTDPDLLASNNPFSKLRSEAEGLDEIAVRHGKRTQHTARAWTAEELESFRARLSMMNEEARLCAKLAIYTGARLKDVSGLVIDDVVLHGEKGSQIHFQHNAIRKVSKDSIERKFPLYGSMLEDLRLYICKRDFTEQKSLTPRYSKIRGSDSLSNLLNKKHIDAFSTDPSLKVHGLRATLQARFDTAAFANKISGYLIGWKNQETIGMQKSYQKQGYPQTAMLEVVKAAHAVTEWATEVQDH